MATTPEQTVSGFDKTLEIPGLEQVMQPKKQGRFSSPGVSCQWGRPCCQLSIQAPPNASRAA